MRGNAGVLKIIFLVAVNLALIAFALTAGVVLFAGIFTVAGLGLGYYALRRRLFDRGASSKDERVFSERDEFRSGELIEGEYEIIEVDYRSGERRSDVSNETKGEG